MNSHHLYFGKVYHKRIFPSIHDFTYPTFFIKLNLNHLSNNSLKSFSVNRFNLFSFYHCDHGFRDERSLFDFAKNILKRENVQLAFDNIILQTYPRILGYVFNPVSFWYLTNQNETVAIIAEVNNTFGETYSYLVLPNDIHNKKLFHVSPFNQIEGHYTFKFHNSEKKSKVQINYFTNNKLKLNTYIEGEEIDFTDKQLLKLFFTYPLYTIKTVWWIHKEAVKLYFKKIPFYGKNGVINDRDTATN